MNGIYLLFLLLICNVSFSSGSPVAKRQATTSLPALAEFLMNNEPTGNEDISTKVEKLMNLLRRHQRDEEDLKYNIKQLLLNFHVPGAGGAHPDSSREVVEHSTYRTRHKTVKDVLRMLNLSTNQNDLLEKIILMMQGRRGNRKTPIGRKPDTFQERQLLLDSPDADSKVFQKIKCLQRILEKQLEKESLNEKNRFNVYADSICLLNKMFLSP
ncbi:hypothetical protein ILUMI_05446 [Ignelater luminosus]|uniref:Uncharacterized protein n=1 Tax=Ignelater luminosus TaxID=2038154 RepID=A0A8K0D7P9_IGNLU|nr:hypothetical protein ILUMI_05446 [Ignelater luminosus]